MPLGILEYTKCKGASYSKIKDLEPLLVGAKFFLFDRMKIVAVISPSFYNGSCFLRASSQSQL
jgi:hypothetical protein